MQGQLPSGTLEDTAYQYLGGHSYE